MDNIELKKLWSEIKKDILACVPEASHTWISNFEAVGFENGVFSVVTGHSIAVQIIRQNHYAQIMDVFKKKGYELEKFDIIYDAEVAKKIKKENEKDLKVQKRQEEKKVLESNIETCSTLRASNLNLKYKFENFVVGSNSKIAHTVAISVAKEPARKYNPLFIYGGSGLGKTHLMQAIGLYTLNNGLKPKYIKTEAFVNDLTSNLMGKGDKTERMKKFRQKYRTVDILLIDDIQFVESKERTMDEIFNIFETLSNKNKQIVITSDRLPKDIPTLPDRLRTRFEMGLVVDITPPDFETRVAILNKLAENLGQFVPVDVINYIADNFSSNVRELEGAFNKVTTYAEIENAELTTEYAKRVLGALMNKREITYSDIATTVAERYEVSLDNLKSSARAHKIAEARQVATYLIRDILNASYEDIAEYFNKKHPTILYSCQKMEEALKSDKDFRTSIENIKNSITESDD